MPYRDFLKCTLLSTETANSVPTRLTAATESKLHRASAYYIEFIIRKSDVPLRQLAKDLNDPTCVIFGANLAARAGKANDQYAGNNSVGPKNTNAGEARKSGSGLSRARARAQSLSIDMHQLPKRILPDTEPLIASPISTVPPEYLREAEPLSRRCASANDLTNGASRKNSQNKGSPSVPFAKFPSKSRKSSATTSLTSAVATDPTFTDLNYPVTDGDIVNNYE